MTKDDSLNGSMKKAMALFSPTMTAKIACLHIKDFARQGPRPIFRLSLEYNVLVDAQGRYRAPAS